MTTTAGIRNGVDVDRLVATIGAIGEDPDLAAFSFRAHTSWVGGAHARTSIQDFHGAGVEDASRTRPFVLEGDEPPVLLGGNRAPNAVEVVLHALGSCLAVGLAYNAAARGIEIRSLELDLEGELDLHGFLGLSDRVRPGYRRLRVLQRVDCDAGSEELAELWRHVERTSPVLDVLRSPVEVTIEALHVVPEGGE